MPRYAVLGLIVLSLMSGGLSCARNPDAIPVREIRVDRKDRAFIDVVFARPLAAGQAGEVVTDPPVAIFPPIGGVWRWLTPDILRFQPAGALPIASELKIVYGDSDFVVKTDDFLVRRVTWTELPSGNGFVMLHGEAEFNYVVAPETLAPRIRLRDASGDTKGDTKVELVTPYHAQTIAWRTAALRKQKLERDVAIVIARDLYPVDGTVTLERDFEQKIRIGSSEHLLVRNITTKPEERETTVRIELSSSVTAEALQGKLSITPETKYRVETEGNDALLIGKFQPGRSYDLAIAEGLVATDSALLRSKVTQTIEVPNLEPLLAFQSEGMFLAATGRRNVAIDALNVTRGKLAIDRVYRNNLFFYLQSAGRSYGYDDEDDGWDEPYYRAYYNADPVAHRYGDRIVEKELTFPAKPNARTTSTIPMGSLVRDSSPGLYKVSVFRSDEEWRASTRWILITDLGIVAKRAGPELLVWVASFKNLAPIANASVALIDDQNQIIARGRTNEEGFWTARGIAEKTRPFMIVADRGDDFSFLLLGQSRIDLSASDVSGATLPASGYLAFLYGERTLYRPGETLRGAAVVRTRDLQHPPRMPLVLQHVDPTGESRGTTRLTADATGMATYEIALPAYTRTGRHTLTLKAGDAAIGSTSFNVEEFVPDRIKVEIETSGEVKPAAPQLTFHVASSYLFGAPASGLSVETRVRLVPSTFSPTGFDGFRFEAPSRKLDPRELATESGKLDDDGRKQFTVVIPEKLAPPSSLQAVITSRVQEQGGRGVAALTRVPVHPYPYYVGLREVRRSDSEKPRRFEWVAVSPAGKEVAASHLRAEVFEDRWHTVLRQTQSGGYAYESAHDSERVQTISISGGKSRGFFEYRPRDWGSYRIVLTDPESLAATEIAFDAWRGSGYSPWAMKNPGRLELTIDKPAHRSGESAMVTIKSPFRGKALITVERDRVLYSTTTTLESNTARVDVPLTAAARPNAYITATVVRTAEDLEPGEAGRAFGTVRVDVDRAENELRPEITAVQEMRSARSLKVAVKTKPNARVTIAAVDQGILQLVGETPPNPFEYFYQRRALEVTTYDIFALLLPEVAAKNKAVVGGSESGEGIAQFLRTDGIRRAKPVAFWSGVLTANDDGIVRTTFAIPEFQGAVRITAVAHAEEQYGSGSALVLVRDPIVVLPTVPRFVSTGDAFSVPVTVRNDTKQNGTFEVTANVTGNGALTNGATQRVTIERQREATVMFGVRASTRGGMKLTFNATGNAERASVASTINVFPSLPDATEELSGTVAGTKMVLPAPPESLFEKGTTRRDVILSPLPILQLRGRLDYLVHYPYGCVEQTTSTAFPMLYLADIASELDPDTFKQRSAPGYVREAIRRLGSMQTAGGGFAMWPYESEVNVWGSVYATHFLVEAKRAGYSVEAHRYDRALEYVAQLAKARTDYDAGGIEQTVYALYVLARANRPDLGTMDYLREQHGAQLTSSSRALLGAAYATLGNRAAMDGMLADIEREENVARETGGNYNSLPRNRALVVLALLDAAPSDPRLPRLADRLARDIAAEAYYTTQDSAMSLVALGQYFRMRKSNATYKGTLALDGKIIGRFDGKTARFTGLPAEGNLSVAFESGYVPDAAYYSVRVRGTPSSSIASAKGLTVTRAFLDRDGKALSATDVPQGEIVVIRTEVASTSGPLQNVAIVIPLPGGLEVENPRLSTTETLPWVQSIVTPQHADIRDDRVVFFVDLQASTKLTFYTVARAITPGEFQLPPAQAEAMYAPMFRATETAGKFRVTGGAAR